MRRTLEQLKLAFNRPVYALPVDVFRILVGFLSFLYFWRTLSEVPDFSSPHGLIDHEMLQDIYWFTRLSLFQHGMGEAFLRAAYLFAMFAAVLLMLGVKTRIAAILLYVIAVSAYRWNFLVIYVEDGIMHLALFWMTLLPIGRTLTLSKWMVRGRAALEDWKHATVPGACVRIFLANLALAYLVTGLWKWTSPMWRAGTALSAALKLPVSRAPDFWGVESLPLLTVANYLALIVEPLFASLIVLPTNHVLKWLLGLFAVGFHAGIIATMDLPFANLAMAAALILIFQHELMGLVHKTRGAEVGSASFPYTFREKLAIFFIVCLIGQMMADVRVPRWRGPRFESSGHGQGFLKEHMFSDALQANPFYAPLWMIGIAQSYRLFDWIDDRNFVWQYAVVDRSHGAGETVEPARLFPSSVRSALLQSTLYGLTWVPVPESRVRDLRGTIYTRAARRYCSLYDSRGPVDVFAAVHRIAVRTDGSRQPIPVHVLRFTCHRRTSDVRYMLLESLGALDGLLR